VFHARAQSDPYFQGYAIAALYSAAASIGRIRELREEAIIAVEAEKPDPDPDWCAMQYMQYCTQPADHEWLQIHHELSTTRICL
jgi:hypothetical protein